MLQDRYLDQIPGVDILASYDSGDGEEHDFFGARVEFSHDLRGRSTPSSDFVWDKSFVDKLEEHFFGSSDFGEDESVPDYAAVTVLGCEDSKHPVAGRWFCAVLCGELVGDLYWNTGTDVLTSFDECYFDCIHDSSPP